MLATAAPVVFHDLPRPFRACDLCDHSRHVGARLTCQHPSAAYVHGVDTPVGAARARGGSCGPEALHLSFPGLEP